MLNGTTVEPAAGTEVEEMFWTVTLLAVSDELEVTSLADGEKETDSVCRSLVAVELGSLDKVDDSSVEIWLVVEDELCWIIGFEESLRTTVWRELDDDEAGELVAEALWVAWVTLEELPCWPTASPADEADEPESDSTWPMFRYWLEPFVSM
jgi:hypothetical protein